MPSERTINIDHFVHYLSFFIYYRYHFKANIILYLRIFFYQNGRHLVFVFLLFLIHGSACVNHKKAYLDGHIGELVHIYKVGIELVFSSGVI